MPPKKQGRQSTCQNTVIGFGRHKGFSLLYVIENDPSYLQWLVTIAKEPLLSNVKAVMDTDYYNEALHEHELEIDMWEGYGGEDKDWC